MHEAAQRAQSARARHDEGGRCPRARRPVRRLEVIRVAPQPKKEHVQDALTHGACGAYLVGRGMHVLTTALFAYLLGRDGAQLEPLDFKGQVPVEFRQVLEQRVCAHVRLIGGQDREHEPVILGQSPPVGREGMVAVVSTCMPSRQRQVLGRGPHRIACLGVIKVLDSHQRRDALPKRRGERADQLLKGHEVTFLQEPSVTAVNVSAPAVNRQVEEPRERRE